MLHDQEAAGHPGGSVPPLVIETSQPIKRNRSRKPSPPIPFTPAIRLSHETRRPWRYGWRNGVVGAAEAFERQYDGFLPQGMT